MKKRLPELDTFRGIAALSVVIYHYVVGQVDASLQWINIGSMGVDMFFIISGFVIFLSVAHSITWPKFLRNRLIRLFPAYWVCVTISTLVLLLSSKSIYYTPDSYEPTNNMLVRYVANMTMLTHYFRINYVDPVYWTLTVELVFYLALVGVIRFGVLRFMERIGAILLLLSASYSFSAVASNGLLHKVVILVPLMAYWPLFFAGILFYKMKFEKATLGRALLTLATLLVQCAIFKNCHRNAPVVHLYQYATTLTAIYALFILLLMDKLAWIVNPVTSWLGRISYGVYLVHYVIGVHFIIPYLRTSWHWQLLPSILVSLVIVLVLADLVNRYVEQPAAAYFKRKKAIAYTPEP